ncbi:Tetratricopeptide-like helical domain [Trichophyton rubrum]|nr:Tetratricopeptide-like helical domain [Trichophyton rubrum]
MEPSGSQHRRNVSVKATRPRSSTKGPLDIPDEPDTRSPTPAAASGNRDSKTSSLPFHPARELNASPKDSSHIQVTQNFSFLRQPEIFHPLSQLEIPLPFRSEFPSLLPGQPLESALQQLNDLCKKGHYLPAAHFAATILTSSLITSTNYTAIFSLLYTRLTCLLLTGNTLLAAEESKALQDLNSSFYYVDVKPDLPKEDGSSQEPPEKAHLAPWPLRVIAVRLQSIGFSDTRRGITGLYDLGLEARRHIIRPGVGAEEKALWKARLGDLGIRVVNALVEMGDLEAARRSLASMAPPSKSDVRILQQRALLHLRVGDVDSAKDLFSSVSSPSANIVEPLLKMAEGKFDEAVTGWNELLKIYCGTDDEVLIKQNLAVCLLYVGDLKQSREILESLVDDHNSFQSLTFNLATVYELCSEDSGALKAALAERVAEHPQSEHRNWEIPNGAFKI